MPAKLQVPANKTLRISHEEPQGGQEALLRPKTVPALKTIAAVPVLRPARLLDPKAFETIKDRSAADHLTPILPDGAGNIGGLRHDIVQAMISSLGDKGPIPKQVVIVQRLRERTELRPRRSVSYLPIPEPEPPERDWLRQMGILEKIHQKIVELAVPEWIRNLHVFSSVLQYDDLVIEANGTLIIGPHITSLTAKNVYMHQGAKVIQNSPYLMVDISGDLRGEMA